MVPRTLTQTRPTDPAQSADASHTVLALDPGKTTGYCYGIHTNKKLILVPDEGELSLVEIYERMREFTSIDDGSNLHIVYEDFNYRNAARMGLDLTPVKVIGVIELFRDRHEPIISFSKQSASTGKMFYTDEKLKELGAYRVGKKHGRDATRHLLQWANFGEGGQWIDLSSTTIELAYTK